MRQAITSNGVALRGLLAVAVGAIALTSCASTAENTSTAPQSAAAPEQSASSATTPRSPLPQVGVSTAGCTEPDPTLTPGTTVTRTVPGAGGERTYLLHVPSGYTPDTAHPAVLTMHGMGTNAFLQLANTGITDSADANGYVVIAPNAVDGRWALPEPGTSSPASADVEFIDQVMADASAALCLDPARQYASGMSMGSAMTLVLACQPQRTFAAFGGVGAAFYESVCAGAPPAPLIYFHGTGDDVVPFAGGTARGFQVEPVPEVMAEWAGHNECEPTPTEAITSEVTLLAWTACADDAVVDFYRIDGGGHTWPGSPITSNQAFAEFAGPTTTTVDATDAMWEFFQRYSLPTEATG
ncbi:MAG: hypothetical protein H6525_08665 [Actinobacteria bacterium]|nr:hypothetical protein [Actinomycetota bacterium]